MGFPVTLTVYDLLKDQGGVIGGLLAFVAGLLAYLAGRAQAKAVDRQNEEFKRTERRRLARTALGAARMIDGILTGIEADISRELIYVSNQQNQSLDSNVIEAMWLRIRMPNISLVWDELAILDQEIIKNYMNLERAIVKLQNRDFLSPTVVASNKALDDLRTSQAIIDSLHGFLKTEFDGANSVLIE